MKDQPKKKTQKQTIARSRLNPTVQLFLAIGLFILSVQASRGAGMQTWEEAVFSVIYNMPDFLYPVFIVVTQLGSIYVLGALLVLYLARAHYHIVLRLLMSGLLAYLVTGFAKDIWGRARPHELLADVVSLDFVVRGPGFPSGHVALATALAFTVWHYLPKQYWIPFFWITGVGLSRMYLGVHAPLDIVGGFAIGWASYALFRHIRVYDIVFAKKHAKT